MAEEQTGPTAFRTRAVHAGEDATAPVRPLSDPIYQTSVFAYHDSELSAQHHAADPREPSYSRDGFPNVTALAAAVADLEGAEHGYAAASGMAAIALVFLAHLSAGDHIVAGTDAYCDTEALLTTELARFGVRSSFVDMGDRAAFQAAITPQTRLAFVETIANPGMWLTDLPAIAAVTRAAGIPLCVDNTFATPALCRPLEHGADLVVHSATKFLGGHHDLMAGVVVGSAELIAPIRRSGYLFGPHLGAMDAWLALRGLRTLAPRMAWISQTAAEIASFLASHPAISAVRYPGLADASAGRLTERLLPDGAGGMLAFDLADGPEAAATLVGALKLIPYAPSLGGTTTTVCYPPRRSGGMCDDPRVHPDTLRLSVGLEAPRDLIADLTQALCRLPTGAERR